MSRDIPPLDPSQDQPFGQEQPFPPQLPRKKEGSRFVEFAVAAILILFVVALILPAIQQPAQPATISARLESQTRAQLIEQAIQEADAALHDRS